MVSVIKPVVANMQPLTTIVILTTSNVCILVHVLLYSVEFNLREPLPPTQSPDHSNQDQLPSLVDNGETPLPKTRQVQCRSHPPSSWSITWGIHPSPGSGEIHRWDHSRAPMVRATWSRHLMEYWWGSEVGQQMLSWLFPSPSSTIDTAPPDAGH